MGLQEVPFSEIRIMVAEETVPTTAAPFHPSATHVDAIGMPVAFCDILGDGTEMFPFHPTSCCGAAASISDGPMYCKKCYHEVDWAYGNVPVTPFRAI